MKSTIKIDFFGDGTPFILIKDYAKNDLDDVRDKLIRSFVHDANETGLKLIKMLSMDECESDGTGNHFALVPNGKSQGIVPSIYTSEDIKSNCVSNEQLYFMHRLDEVAKKQFPQEFYKKWEEIYNLFITEGKPWGGAEQIMPSE